MSDDHTYPPLSPVSTGLAGRCPRCGEGRLFSGFLSTAPRCSNCDLDFAFIDSGDGPAVFVIFIVGIVVVGAAFYVEFTWRPAYWVHLVLWLPAILILSLGLLRPLKGLMIAQQYHRKAEEARHGGRGGAEGIGG